MILTGLDCLIHFRGQFRNPSKIWFTCCEILRNQNTLLKLYDLQHHWLPFNLLLTPRHQYRIRKLNTIQKHFFQVQSQLKSESCQHQNLSYKSGLKFNNSRYNASLSNGKQVAFCIAFFSTFHYITVYLHKNMIISEYDILLYRKFLVEPIILKISLPILYTIYRQDVCQFMWRVICNYVNKKLLIDIHSNI